MTLIDKLPDGAEPDEVFDAFTDWTSEHGFTPVPTPGRRADRGRQRRERDPFRADPDRGAHICCPAPRTNRNAGTGVPAA
jgi:hypothetical protein